MTDLVRGATELTHDSAAAYAVSLLRHYSFDLDRANADHLLSHWIAEYPPNWVRLAVIEALYQGRYKGISVEQILAFWKRRGQPLYHFNHEFERLICEKLPRDLTPARVAPPPETDLVEPVSSAVQSGLPYRRVVPQLPSLRAASTLRQPIEILPLQLSDDSDAASATDTGANDDASGSSIVSSLRLLADIPPPNAQVRAEAQMTASQPAAEPTSPLILELLVSSMALADRSLLPKLRLGLMALHLEQVGDQRPIDQFTPLPQSSQSYSKLQAVARSAEPEE